MTVPLKAAEFLEEDSLGFVRKILHQKVKLFGNSWKLCPCLNHDLLRLEVVPRGKWAFFMTQVSLRDLGNTGIPRKKRYWKFRWVSWQELQQVKPPQVIHHHKALPFLTNKQTKRNPTKEKSFPCVFTQLWDAILNISGRSSIDAWRNIENKIDTSVFSGRPGF